MLSVSDLCCIRGTRTLFSGVGFHLGVGDWLRVTGDNGAGKTSLLRMLCGLSPPEHGEIRWDGTAIPKLGDEYHGALAYLGHMPAVKDDLTVIENLALSVRIAGGASTDDALDGALRKVGLHDRRYLPARFLSQGQRRRVALARLLCHDVGLWILDEPFVALDADGISMLSEVIAGHLARDGIAVLTSHQDVPIPGRPAQVLHLAS